MSRGCARITKPPYTPPRGTCLFMNLLIRLRVTDNKCMSSSDLCEYSKVDTSTTHSLLASSVPCIALFSPRELAHTSPVHPNPWHDMLCHHKPPYIFPQNSHHPYLQGISIAFPRYIPMQHPPSHDLIFMSYMLLA